MTNNWYKNLESNLMAIIFVLINIPRIEALRQNLIKIYSKSTTLNSKIRWNINPSQFSQRKMRPCQIFQTSSTAKQSHVKDVGTDDFILKYPIIASIRDKLRWNLQRTHLIFTSNYPTNYLSDIEIKFGVYLKSKILVLVCQI
jgi:hypothetical protein